MSGVFDSRKDFYLIEFKQRPRVFVKLILESCVIQSYLVYILLIIWPQFIELKIKDRSKTERQAVSS